jgi:hypothetical protein
MIGWAQRPREPFQDGGGTALTAANSTPSAISVVFPRPLSSEIILRQASGDRGPDQSMKRSVLR